MGTKKTFELTILQQPFTLKSEDDEKHVKSVADYVNKKMHEIVAGQKAVSTANVAILTALNIADDYCKLREKQQVMMSHWVQSLEDLVKRLEENKAL